VFSIKSLVTGGAKSGNSIKTSSLPGTTEQRDLAPPLAARLFSSPQKVAGSFLPPFVIAVGTAAICWKLLVSPFQFAINDLAPFGSAMLNSCFLTYQNAGLGRENPHTSPSLCGYGALSSLVGGVNAQHLFLVGCLVLAGLSMYYLLRRIGNPKALCLVGAAAYELSPIMLSFQTSGEGLLVTAALLPAVLLGTIPTPKSSPYIEGARTGAVLALICYANAQAPALAVFLLVPAIGMLILWRAHGYRRYALIYCAAFGIVFLLAATPVLQILSGFGRTVEASRQTLQNDLVVRLDWDSAIHFVTPYLIVGAIPALLAFLLLPTVRDARRAEWAAAVSLVSIVVLWETLQRIGPVLVIQFPIVALYKDFIKLQILLAVPLMILSVAAMRWAIGWMRTRQLNTYSLGVPLAVLLLLPLALGHQPPVIYETGLPSVLNGQALLSGQLGLPSWAEVPRSYADVLNKLRREDPHPLDYRVLWIPIDWRLLQMSRTADTNLLLYWADGSAQSQAAISTTFDAVVDGKVQQIAPLLADLGVKYVVLDLVEGQDRNSEAWEKGSPTNLSVWGTQALTGRPADYKAILSKARGLSLVEDTGSWVVYRNLDWRPILSSYSGLLTVNGSLLSNREWLDSLWHELPDFLIEAGDPAPVPASLAGRHYSFGAGTGVKGSESKRVRLLTGYDLSLANGWVVDRSPSALGIERFNQHGNGSITVSSEILRAAPIGSRIVWLEYTSSETEPTNGLIGSVAVAPGRITINCNRPNCIIANVLLVPPLPNGSQIARFGYAYSPLLRAPDGDRAATAFPGDWASLYSPPPRGYPSSVTSSSSELRLFVLVFGYFVAFAGLIAGLVFAIHELVKRTREEGLD
jgi:hypothetical protein